MQDVIIIGAGIMGCAVARELSRYQLDVLVLERAADVCEGATKANSAICHSGLDAHPNTKKAYYNVKGNELYYQLEKELGLKVIRNGSLNICLEEEGRPGIEALLQQGIKNGVPGLRIVEKDELFKMESNLHPDTVCALWAPSAGIVDSFEVNIALAENASSNGVEFKFNTKVVDVIKNTTGFVVKTEKGDFQTKWVINCAGIHSDEINNMVSSHQLKIHSRRGEYYLLDKYEKDLVKSTIFQQPTKVGKGVLVAPTVSDNIIVGPNAHEVAKDDTTTTAEGLLEVAMKSFKGVHKVPLISVITTFAGLRATGESGDFEIGEATDVPGFYNCACIESPGLTSAPAIAVDVAKEVAAKLQASENKAFNPIRKRPVVLMELSDDEKDALIKENPAYGRMVCRCEMISEGEVLDALNRPVGATTVDGIKRRTRAGSGRCQAGFCLPKQIQLLIDKWQISPYEVSKRGLGSNFLVGRNKDAFLKQEDK